MSVTQLYSDQNLWTEKYRPKNPDDLVADDEFKEKIRAYLSQPNKMNHQIYIGPPGCGKTTTARILIDNIIEDKSDILILNGSMDKGIQVIRESIMEFVKTPSVFSPLKIVFIDEADNLTSDAWKSLRFILENYSETKFIMTGNKDTFPDYIKSRCNVRKFNKLPIEYIVEYTSNILQNEGISYNNDDLLLVVNTFYPDVRRTVSVLQELSLDGTLDISKLSDTLSNEEKVASYVIDYLINLINGDNRSAHSVKIALLKFVPDRYIDYHKVYKILFEKLSFKLLAVKVVIAKYTNKLPYTLEPTMLFYEFIDIVEQTMQEQILPRIPISPNEVVTNNDLEVI